jgi:DNA-binding NarL/FixJ family response regulator
MRGRNMTCDSTVGGNVDDNSRVTLFLLVQNRLLREALAKILSKKADITVAGSCALSSDSSTEIIAAAPDILVMDSFTTHLAHIAFVRKVRQSVSAMKLVMIGMDGDEHHFLQAVREGALGYVLKDASALEVVAAVRAVANGGAACDPRLCAYLFRFAAEKNQMPNFHIRSKLGLTNRQQQLVGLISRGLTNKEIAAELQLAEYTIRNHIHRMLRKLGATHRLAVVDICRTEGASV